MATAKRKPRLDEARIDRLCNRACFGFRVPVMQLGKLARIAAECIALGQSDDQVLYAMRSFLLMVAEVA